MDRCLLDTSVLSDVMLPAAKRPSNVERHLKGYLRAQGRLSFSEISCYEVLRGLRKKRATAQLRRFTEFCHHCELLPVTFDVFDRAASLWADGQRQGIVIDDSDLMIAATAMILELRLVTSNTRHFAWIVGLPLLNWREP
jgi:tRNA(fMet)-specific endonuclease VapC